MSVWVGLAISGMFLGGTIAVPGSVWGSAQPSGPPVPEPKDPDNPNNPDPPPRLPTDPVDDDGNPLPPDDPNNPDPPPEPPPPRLPPDPEPVPPDGGGGGGDGTQDPPPDDNDEPTDEVERLPVAPAPFADLDVADRGSEVNLGGDLTIGPRCKDEELTDAQIDGDEPLEFVCDNYRIGLRARVPISQSSASGSGRGAIDSLNGFAGSWRVGGAFDWIRDVTSDDSTSAAKFYQLGLEAAWGVQTFRFTPDGNTDSQQETRHSIQTKARFLAYIHPPKKTRVAPQVLLRYDRQWSDSDPVGVLLDDGDPMTPAFTVPRIINSPVTTPSFAVTVPVLISVQSGKGRAGKALANLGFGPAVSYAAAGDGRGYNPFNDVHVLRLETWLYWYPTGKAGALATSKTNVRIGVSPLVDVFLTGRNEGEPRIDYGVLAEVKIGVRGYEY